MKARTSLFIGFFKIKNLYLSVCPSGAFLSKVTGSQCEGEKSQSSLDKTLFLGFCL